MLHCFLLYAFIFLPAYHTTKKNKKYRAKANVCSVLLGCFEGFWGVVFFFLANITSTAPFVLVALQIYFFTVFILFECPMIKKALRQKICKAFFSSGIISICTVLRFYLGKTTSPLVLIYLNCISSPLRSATSARPSEKGKAYRYRQGTTSSPRRLIYPQEKFKNS